MRIALALIALIVLLGLAAAPGCKSHSNPEPTGPAAPPTVSEINAAKMQNAVVPQAVQNAFARDYPGAAINTIEMQSTSAGDSFYKIVFIRDGKPGAAQYFATGAPFPK